MTKERIGDDFAAIARALREEPSELLTLEKAISLATEVINGCDHAGVTIVKFGEAIRTPAATSHVALRGDELQYELDEGPCLDATRLQQTTLSPDLLTEPRWPRWAPRVGHELGVRSMLSLQLFTTADNLGALNLYSERPSGFDINDQNAGLALAAHIAVALSASQDLENGRLDLVNSALIGRAQGLLMERFSISASQAFLLLHRMSRESDGELLDVARKLIEDPRGT